MGRSRSLALLLGAVAGAVGLVALSFVILRSQGQARVEAIDRFADRGELAAQLLAGVQERAATRQSADAQVRLAGDPSEEALRRWEGAADRAIPYTALFDDRGRLLAVHPDDAQPARTEAGGAALRAATKGRTGTSGVVSTSAGPVIETFVPFSAGAEGLRVLIIAVPTDLFSQLAEGALQGVTGTPRGTAFLADRSGTLIAAAGIAPIDGRLGRQVAGAIRGGRSEATIGDDHLLVQRIPASSLVVALVAPEADLTAALPATAPPRIALAGLAVALLAVVWLAARTVRDARRLEEARETAERASRLATEANQAKSDFLARMSHELRTPLNAMLGFAQLLGMEALPADQRQSVDQIMKGGEHLLELINEVLDIAQIESGELRLFLEPVPIVRAVDDAADLIKPLAEGRGIDLRVQLDGDASMRRVLADERRLGQVLLNLLANAVKYTEGTVSVTATRLEGDRLRLSVTDTGPGISEEKLSGLFTPFERLGAEATAVQGTGLGLALSQQLVIAMGGQIGVESTVGDGTTFWVELPEAEEGSGDGTGSSSLREEAPVSSG